MSDVRDTFIGNLHNISSSLGNAYKDVFVDNFRRFVSNANRQQNGVVPGSNNYGGKIRSASVPMNEPRTWEQENSAKAGTLFMKEPEISGNSKFEAMHITAMPHTEKDWEAFVNGLDDFRVVLDAYAKEPNQDERIKIIEQSAPRFQDSRKLNRYLYALHENELANKRGEYDDYNYKDQPAYLEEAIRDMLSLHYKKA